MAAGARFRIGGALLVLGGCALPEYATHESLGTGGQETVAGGQSGSAAPGAGGTGGSTGGNGRGGAGAGGSGGAASCVSVPPAKTIACGQAKPVAVAVDATAVYWVNEGDGRVLSVPKEAGSPSVVATGQGQPCGAVVRGGYLYWRTRGGAVRRKLVPDGALEDLALAQGDSCAVDADAAAVFWFSEEAGQHRLTMASPPGSSPVVVATALAPVDLDAQGAGEVGWTDGAAGKAYTSPKAMGDAKTQIAVGGVHGIAFRGPDWFVTDALSGAVHVGQTGNASQSFAQGLDEPTGVATWGSTVVLLEEGAGRVLRKYAGTPASVRPTVLVEGVQPCGQMAVDAAYAYFATCGDGRVMRVPHLELVEIEERSSEQ